MWKRVIGVLLLVVLVIVLVVGMRTSRVQPVSVQVPAVAAVVLDDAGAVQRFVGAIRIPTESAYGQPPNADQIGKFRDYLQTSFPHVAAQLPREVLKGGAVIYSWTGRDPAAAPVVLMGHMDVVPVPAEALPQWTHPPYSGEIADGYIWGRGTIDDKIHVLSLLEATETLLAQGFVPARTILFCFGDDEENGGSYGAQQIVAELKARDVHPEFVVDEGGAVVSGIVPGIARPLAIIGTAEKGYLDLSLSTVGVGGHSSEPPAHTAIGRLAAALVKLEAHPFPASLPAVVREQFTAIAPYLPVTKRAVLANLWLFEPLVVKQGVKDPRTAGNYRTTTAETMVSGGFKDNALPPSAKAIVNFRILPGETVESVVQRVRQIVDDPRVTIAIENPSAARNPSPVSPLASAGYETLATTIRELFPTAAISPYLVNAGTDAGFYTALTPNVYRFLALDADASILSMIHGLNERVAPEKYLQTVRFTVQLIENIH
jgi:carboxypeptidase PM20D1